MVDKHPVQSQTHFETMLRKHHEKDIYGDDEERIQPPVPEAVWHFWSEASTKQLLVIPEWFSKDELDGVRPFLLGEVEYDDPSSGAVLFSNVQALDIGTVRESDYSKFSFAETTEEIDLTDEEYYDAGEDEGKVWIPRSVFVMYTQVNA